MTDISIAELTGGESGFGSNGQDPNLVNGYVQEQPVVYLPPLQIGDGLAGPANDQALQIFRDNRPIATDELGMQGPFRLKIGTVARHRAGRNMPLNFDWYDGLDPSLPGMEAIQQQLAPSPFPSVEIDNGFGPVEVVASPNTVFFTANPATGWDGY